MSLNIPSVSYAYASGPIGFEAVGASAVIEADSSLQNIYNNYAAIFQKYGAIHSALLGQLNSILGKAYTDEGELDLSQIFDENELRFAVILGAPKVFA